jgi:hypothetical protein
MSAGKGDKPRPLDKKTYDQNFDQIQWENKESKTIDVKTKKGKTTYRY